LRKLACGWLMFFFCSWCGSGSMGGSSCTCLRVLKCRVRAAHITFAMLPLYHCNFCCVFVYQFCNIHRSFLAMCTDYCFHSFLLQFMSKAWHVTTTTCIKGLLWHD
jgi:hypothetical protein